jgi:hypothetical protein
MFLLFHNQSGKEFPEATPDDGMRVATPSFQLACEFTISITMVGKMFL